MSFIEELRRRNVIRVAAAYAAVGWLVLQVAETTLPAFGFGDAAIRVLIIALVAGFIPAVIVAWAFEWTPEGVKRDADVDPVSRHSKGFDRFILIMLAIAVGYFLIDKFVIDPARDQEALQAARQEGRAEAIVEEFGDDSIAVLPFENLSSDPEQEYFGDGLAEEMLNLLARIPELRVISRTSAFKFKGSEWTVPEIARELHVAHVLEGSVRKSGDRIRITAQLIDAHSDKHIWSNTYDRTLDDIFAIQDEVAAAVVEQLHLTLVSDLPVSEKVDTRAYELYWRARNIWSASERERYEEARSLLGQALEIEPDWIDALEILGNIQSATTWEYPVGIAERVLSLDPDNASAVIWRYDMTAPIRERIAVLEEAAALDPRHSGLLFWASQTASDLGRADQAIAISEYLIDRNPLWFWNQLNLADQYFKAGRVEDSLSIYERAIALNEDAGAVRWKYSLALLMAGDAEEALEQLKLADSHAESYQVHGFAVVYHALGEYEKSAEYFADLEEHAAESWPHGLARAYALVGETDKAFDYLGRVVEREPGAVAAIATNPIFRSLHDDPRWLPFLESVGQLPEQLAAIEFDVRAPQPGVQ